MIKRARDYLTGTVPCPRWFPILMCLYVLVHMGEDDPAVLVYTLVGVALFQIVMAAIRRHRRHGGSHG